MKDLLPRVDARPDEDQEALVEAARGIEAERTGVYQASAAEPAAIDRGLDEARAGRFADSEALAQVRATPESEAVLLTRGPPRIA
ncbi:MAG TPA: hypothetical protein VFE63_12185 [Roseiarcus sp.]|nr:hypothetical protein [Roseiarcus sp.]